MELMGLHGTGKPLKEWAIDNEPIDEMLWKKGYWHQVMFVRDDLASLFYKTYQESIDNPMRVVSTHMSKSITLPVYSIKAAGLTIVIRYNFFNWKISVLSDEPVADNFYQLFDRKEIIHPVYCEGFPDAWVFGAYADNQRQFTVELGSEYSVYTFLYLATRSRVA